MRTEKGDTVNRYTFHGTWLVTQELDDYITIYREYEAGMGLKGVE